jgi:hypothetical protein
MPLRIDPVGEVMDSAAYLALLSDHAAWLETGRAMMSAAELIWPNVQGAFDRIFGHVDALRIARESGRQVPMTGTPMALNASEIPEFLGVINAYLLNAGYAVENLLKAVRIKRLSLQQKPIGFGGGSDCIPRSHNRYDDFATVELGALTDAEIERLRRLSLYVRWAGRYPTPTAPPPIDELNRRSGSSTDRDVVRALCERLIKKYESLQ